MSNKGRYFDISKCQMRTLINFVLGRCFVRKWNGLLEMNLKNVIVENKKAFDLTSISLLIEI
jgi:hypothetical protein